MFLNAASRLSSLLKRLAHALCSIVLWLAQRYATLELSRWL